MPTDYNQKVIEEFRANHGKLLNPKVPMNLLLLTTTGEKTGKKHTTPVAFNIIEDELMVIASKGGAPENPQWYNNLVANPTVTVELGDETFQATAQPITNENERERMFDTFAEMNSNFKEYKTKTGRKIPVIILRRQD